jgi:putative transposase
MVQRQLKLRLKSRQKAQLDTWLWHLTGVYNWALRKIELDANDGIYYTPKTFHNLLAGHGKTLGIPSHTLQGILDTAYTAWQHCFKKLSKKPRLKGQRNKLNSIPFPDPIKAPQGTSIRLPGLGPLRFHKQSLPDGKIKGGRLVKRASGWYLCLIIDTAPNDIPHLADGAVGIDPGFLSLLTLSTGEKIRLSRNSRGNGSKLILSSC